MSEFEQGAGFRMCGVVQKKYTNSAGTFGNVDLEYKSRDNRRTFNRLVSFNETVVNEIAQLEEGMTVEVTGEVGSEKVTNKDKSTVKKDGRELWVPMLRLRTIKVDPSSVGRAKPQAPQQSEQQPPNLDDIPF